MRSLGHPGARSQHRVGAGLRGMRPGRVVLTHAAWPRLPHLTLQVRGASTKGPGRPWPSSLRPFLMPLPFPVSTWGDPAGVGSA